MFKFEKITSKHLLISIFVFNSFLLFSFLGYVLLVTDLLPSSLFFISKPIEFLSINIFLVLIVLIIEISIILSWTKKRQQISSNVKTEEVNDLEFNFENINDNSIQARQEIEEELDNLIDYNAILDYSQDSSDAKFSPIFQSIEINQNDGDTQIEDENFEISPGFLSPNDELVIDETDNDKINKFDDLLVLQNQYNDDKPADPILNDRQFAFYKGIVNEEWVYECAFDRERIGFDKNAIDESNISLFDLNKLIKTGMLYKQNISFPSGSFATISSTPYIEEKIIFATIRRICRKNRIKIVKRKIDFLNWKEFGLSKKIWQFSFEFPNSAIVGSVWCNDSFVVNGNNISILQERKDELKALIATAALKMKKDGLAIIITNDKDHIDLIKKYVKNSGWGEVKILNFSDSKFADKLIKTINRNS